MAYLQHTSWKDRPGAVAGVIAIHALIGYALVTGLSFKGIIETIDNPDGVFVEPIPLPPPPPPADETVTPEKSLATPPIHVPTPPLDLSDQRPVADTTELIFPTLDPIPKVIPGPTPGPTIAARPAFTPQGAKPKGSPSQWVTVNDYRSSWINREITGIARFRLEIAANGRVENCAITDSSGHPELDRATCALVSQRARFDPAKDETGAKVTGSYSNAVRWELPE